MCAPSPLTLSACRPQVLHERSIPCQGDTLTLIQNCQLATDSKAPAYRALKLKLQGNVQRHNAQVKCHLISNNAESLELDQSFKKGVWQTNGWVLEECLQLKLLEEVLNARNTSVIEVTFISDVIIFQNTSDVQVTSSTKDAHASHYEHIEENIYLFDR